MIHRDLVLTYVAVCIRISVSLPAFVASTDMAGKSAVKQRTRSVKTGSSMSKKPPSMTPGEKLTAREMHSERGLPQNDVAMALGRDLSSINSSTRFPRLFLYISYVTC